jgi:hypothetical protein
MRRQAANLAGCTELTSVAAVFAAWATAAALAARLSIVTAAAALAAHKAPSTAGKVRPNKAMASIAARAEPRVQ